jgi:ATP-dependent DNA ligase
MDHVFEPSWGGRRALAFIEPGRRGWPSLRLFDATGRDLGPLMPELRRVVELVAEPPVILDGELVVPDPAGRTDRAAMERRLAGKPSNGKTPVYLVFDLLWAGGRPLMAQPLVKRRERLARLVTPSAELVILPGLVGEGRELHFAVAQQGLAGVMARHLRSPYLPGRRSDLWRWIPTQPGEVPLHALPDPDPAPARPVLALIQKLPLDD